MMDVVFESHSVFKAIKYCLRVTGFQGSSPSRVMIIFWLALPLLFHWYKGYPFQFPETFGRRNISSSSTFIFNTLFCPLTHPSRLLICTSHPIAVSSLMISLFMFLLQYR